MRTLHTVQDVVDALGGRKAVARIVGLTDKAVHNWAQSKGFPSRTYVVLRDALAERGFEADVSLFSFAAPTTEGDHDETAE